MAIIKEVGIGLRDTSKPILWFTVQILDGRAALNVFSWEQAAEIIEEYSLDEVSSLNGMPCQVKVEDGMMKYSGPVLV